MGIKCGHCGNTHTTVNQVKACGGGVQAPAGPAMATEKQVAFLNRLLAERPALRDVENLWPDVVAKMTKADASAKITEVMATPKEAQAAQAPKDNLTEILADVPDGYYAIDSLTGNNDLDFIRVGTNQGRENPANKGKRRVQRYLGGQGITYITFPEQVKFAKVLATFDQTALIGARSTFGTQVGRCGCCGKSLTDQLSRALGIGPDCRQKVGV